MAAGRQWEATFYRKGTEIATTTTTANRYGNVPFATRFAAEDDDRITVVARSKGHKIVRTIDLAD